MSESRGDASRESRKDPRDVITPDAFRVAPELLGQPLAAPWRRGAALLIDFALIGILLLLKEITGAFFVLVAGALLVWAARRPERAEGLSGRSVRLVVRAAAVILVLVGAGRLIAGLQEPTAGGVPAEVSSTVARQMGTAGGALGELDPGTRATLGEVPGLVQDVTALERTTDSAAAARLSGRVARRLARLGTERDEISDALEEALEDGPSESWRDPVVAGALASLDTLQRTRTRTADSLARQWTAALAAEDTSRADSLRPRLAAALGGGELERLRDENERLEDELDAARETRGPVDYVRGLAEDLGVGLGWTGLYFTVFLAFWKGRTPGKRVLGIRVERLTGEPLGWWDAFGRFAGYAAGLATGLIGFLQIFWDANRQGIHDRIVGTVVVRERT